MRKNGRLLQIKMDNSVFRTQVTKGQAHPLISICIDSGDERFPEKYSQELPDLSFHQEVAHFRSERTGHVCSSGDTSTSLDGRGAVFSRCLHSSDDANLFVDCT